MTGSLRIRARQSHRALHLWALQQDAHLPGHPQSGPRLETERRQKGEAVSFHWSSAAELSSGLNAFCWRTVLSFCRSDTHGARQFLIWRCADPPALPNLDAARAQHCQEKRLDSAALHHSTGTKQHLGSNREQWKEGFGERIIRPWNRWDWGRRDALPCKLEKGNEGNKDIMAGSDETASVLLRIWQLAEAIFPGEAQNGNLGLPTDQPGALALQDMRRKALR